MDESPYALGFSYFDGIGPKKYAHLLKEFGTAKAAWNATNEDHLRVLGKTSGPRFIAFRDTFDFDEKQEELESAGAWFVDVGSSEYPHLLREIPNPPIVLFGIGDKTLLTSFKER
jgi:DNA processing protein